MGTQEILWSRLSKYALFAVCYTRRALALELLLAGSRILLVRDLKGDLRVTAPEEPLLQELQLSSYNGSQWGAPIPSPWS
jgi:hypothetical protein